MEVETPAEKYERCDGYVDFGPMHRGMMITDEVLRRAGRKLTPEELIAAESALTPADCHEIYLAGIMAAGKTKEEAEEILMHEALGGFGCEKWEGWYIKKLIEAGKISAEEWGEFAES